MIICKSNYAGLTGYILENKRLRVTVLPQLGGKISSIIYRESGFELLAVNKKNQLTCPHPGSDFGEYEIFGVDDMFPTIDSCEVIVNGQMVSYPNHGEIWSLPMEVQNSENALKLAIKSKLLPYTYQKELTLSEGVLNIDYQITNTGTNRFPCIWAWHGLVRYEPDMRLIYPKGSECLENVIDSPELGPIGKEYHLKNEQYDFFGVPSATSGTMMKYYVSEPVKEGVCGYYYPSHKIKCLLEYAPEKLPYLGFWLTAGGLDCLYHCAWEPATGYYDSINTANKYKRLQYLEAGETFQFTIKLRLQNILV